jgi:hypothetical protein
MGEAFVDVVSGDVDGGHEGGILPNDHGAATPNDPKKRGWWFCRCGFIRTQLIACANEFAPTTAS